MSGLLAARRRGAPLSPSFWAIWCAGSISCIGDGVTFGALPLLAASLTRDPRLVSLVDALNTAGWLLLGLISGVVADRVRRLALMWRVDLLRAAVTGLLAVLVLSDQVTIVVLYVVGPTLGLLTPFFDNATGSVLPELVHERDFERANSLTQVATVLGTNLLGPPLGAALFVAAAGSPFVVDAITFAVAAAVVARVDRSRRDQPNDEDQPAERETLMSQLRQGIDFLRFHRVLRALALTLVVLNGVVSGVTAILVLYVLEVLRLPQQAYGLLLAAFAVGGVLGSVVVSRAIRTAGQRICALGAVAGFGTAASILGLTRNPGVAAGGIVVAGVSMMVWNVVSVSYRQRVIPRRLLGRVTSVYRMLAFGAMPVGAVSAGLLSHVVGIPRTYLLGGLLLILATIRQRTDCARCLVVDRH